MPARLRLCSPTWSENLCGHEGHRARLACCTGGKSNEAARRSSQCCCHGLLPGVAYTHPSMEGSTTNMLPSEQGTVRVQGTQPSRSTWLEGYLALGAGRGAQVDALKQCTRVVAFISDGKTNVDTHPSLHAHTWRFPAQKLANRKCTCMTPPVHFANPPCNPRMVLHLGAPQLSPVSQSGAVTSTTTELVSSHSRSS